MTRYLRVEKNLIISGLDSGGMEQNMVSKILGVSVMNFTMEILDVQKMIQRSGKKVCMLCQATDKQRFLATSY